ncbi:MAG: ABC transporter permease [Saprospiraceae bacterium]|nr:ABC transporter permease [Saprospiraceae bacterium]
MNQFIIFVQKEFKHIFRDRRTLFILLGIPIVQILLFGFALTNEVKNSQLVILDSDKSETTKAIADKMIASDYFDFTGSIAEGAEMEPTFKAGKADMILVFPANFEQQLFQSNKATIQLITDASDPNLANTLVNYASAIIGDYQQEMLEGKSLPYKIETRTRMLYNPQLKGAFNFVPGVMAMVLMLICAMMTSISIVREKENGNMEVLLVSPLKPFTLIFAKSIPYLLLSILNLTSILLLSVFLLDLPIRGSIILLYAVSILFIMTALSLGLMISNVADSQMTAMFIALIGLLLPTIMLSGFMFPIENMPLPLRALSNIVPSKWYYSIIKSVMIKGLGFFSIWKESLILLGMTMFFLIISWRKFNIRLA